MKALSYANQQANQLLQIRGLLMAQQNVIATRLQAQADQEARWQVEHEKAVENRIKPLENPKTFDELFDLPKRRNSRLPYFSAENKTWLELSLSAMVHMLHELPHALQLLARLL